MEIRMLDHATLPAISNAAMPSTYEAARVALAQCSQVDECKDWSDKAAALASYAKQADDEQLERMAQRIRARALRRAGELLKQFDGRGGDQSKSEDTHTFGQSDAAREAGMSKHQQVQSVRIANVPEVDFDRQVEGDKPPTISQLASQGITRRPVLDLKGRDPHDFNKAMHFVGTIEDAAKLMGKADPLTLSILTPSESQRLRKALLTIDAISDQLSTRI